MVNIQKNYLVVIPQQKVIIVLGISTLVVRNTSPFETGLYMVGLRYYDPQVGRWLNADLPQNSLMQIGAGADFMNLYAYCLNNPIMHTDPTGQFVITLSTLLIIAAIGIAAGATYGGVSAAMRGDDIWDGIWKGALIGGMIGLSVGLVGVGAFGFAGVAGVGAIKAGGLAAAVAFGAGTTSLFAVNSAINSHQGSWATMNMGHVGAAWGVGLLAGGISGAVGFGIGQALGSLGSQMGFSLAQKGMMGLQFGKVFGTATMMTAGYWGGRGLGILINKEIMHHMGMPGSSSVLSYL